jgi:hypothetical protein
VPGVAKTSIINQIAAIYGFDVITVMLSQMTPEHITGYPYLDDDEFQKKVMEYAKAHWWPTKGKTILLFDEFGQCPIPVSNVAMQIINEGRCGPHVLPDDCFVFGAGNKAEHRAGSGAMTTTARTRWNPVVEIVPTKAEWLDHAKEMEFNPMVVAYVERIRDNVVHFDPRAKGGFVTLRTLEQGSQIVELFDSDCENPDMRACLVGCWGEDTADQFMAFAQTISAIPTIAQITEDPMHASVVADMVNGVGAVLANGARYSDLADIAAYIERYDAESQAVLVRSLPDRFHRHPDIERICEVIGC